MQNTHPSKLSRTSFDYFQVRARCAGCGSTDEQHTIRTWWSAPNRTTGWDAPTTSGASLTVGAKLARLSRVPTEYRGESRCGGCGRSLRWAIRSVRGLVVAIRPAELAA